MADPTPARPFWQVVVLTLVTGAVTGVATYTAAHDDGTGTAQQAVRGRSGGGSADTEGADMTPESSRVPQPPVITDVPPTPTTAPTTPRAPRTKPVCLHTPTPHPTDPAVQRHQRALAR